MLPLVQRGRDHRLAGACVVSTRSSGPLDATCCVASCVGGRGAARPPSSHEPAPVTHCLTWLVCLCVSPLLASVQGPGRARGGPPSFASPPARRQPPSPDRGPSRLPPPEQQRPTSPLRPHLSASSPLPLLWTPRAAGLIQGDPPSPNPHLNHTCEVGPPRAAMCARVLGTRGLL